jgi:hypothetical protein
MSVMWHLNVLRTCRRYYVSVAYLLLDVPMAIGDACVTWNSIAVKDKMLFDVSYFDPARRRASYRGSLHEILERPNAVTDKTSKCLN